MRPVIKWVGGKRQLLPVIVPLIPHSIDLYVEPFVGGGAVMSALKPTRARINDANAELINLYAVIRDNVEELIAALSLHAKQHCAGHFYTVRGWDRDSNYDARSKVEKAARFLYLNRTCYNGLYRVNRLGQFNSPHGRYKNPQILQEAALREFSDYLQQAQVECLCGDYRDALKGLPANAFVYLDPPYMPISATASFTSYTGDGFSKADQVILRDACRELDEQGVRFLLSNSAHEFIVDLYRDFIVQIVPARRAVNSRAAQRGVVNEVLIRNYVISSVEYKAELQ